MPQKIFVRKFSVDSVNWTELDTVVKKYDWVFACYTETSCGLKLDIVSLKSFSERISAQLAIDATASIGLESHHEFADVITQFLQGTIWINWSILRCLSSDT